MFGTLLISICTLMQIYVFWRMAGMPLIRRRLSGAAVAGTGVALWAVLVLGRVMGRDGTGLPAAVLEWVGMQWMGFLFLIAASILAVDLLTAFGLVFPRRARSLRTWALMTGLALSLAATFQGMRPPVMETYTVNLPGLPAELDGTVILAVSDLHLSHRSSSSRLSALTDRVQAENPDMVVLLGDIFEGRRPPEGRLAAIFQRIGAPLGVFAVAGNHESHGNGSADCFAAAGSRLLHNQWHEVKPGLVMAGVEDLTSLRRNGKTADPIATALAGRPPGATILLSHTPKESEKAAAEGVGLMLSGHTHGGQIWPFGYLVRHRYPLLEGRYAVNGMTAIVSRGAGTWGPRMRLWQPAQILKITLAASP